MTPKQKIVSFTCDEDMAALLAKASFDGDFNKSEIIRTCILLSIDTVCNTPSLVNRLQQSDRKDYHKVIL